LLGILICVLGFVTTVLRGGVSLSLRGVRSLSDLGRLRLVSRYDCLRLMGCLSSLGCVCVFRLLCRGSCSVLRLIDIVSISWSISFILTRKKIDMNACSIF